MLLLLPLAIGLFAIGANTGPAARLRNEVFDQFQRLAPRTWSVDLPVRVVDIDDESLARLGQWPWPRSRIAQLSNKLADNGAAVVAWDVIFSEEDRQSVAGALQSLPDVPERKALATALATRGLMDDDTLAKAFARVPTVLAMSLGNETGAVAVSAKWGIVALGDNPAPFITGHEKALLPLPQLVEAAAGLGSVNYVPDGDLVVRRAPLFLKLGIGPDAQLIPSLPLEALRLAFGASSYQIKASNASGETGLGTKSGIVAVRVGETIMQTEADGEIRVRFAGFQPARHFSAWKVLAGEVPKDSLEGRIVLVGATAEGLNDLRATPLGVAVPGVDAHAEVIEHILSASNLVRPDYAPGVEAVVLILVSLLVAWGARQSHPLPATIGLFAVIASALAASWSAFVSLDLLFEPVVPALSWIAIFLLLTISTYRRTERERRTVRHAFSRYLAPAIVERLAANPSALQLGGEARNMSILFCDARDFTTRSETMGPEDVVLFLNDLHTPLTNLVLAESGTIDKYIGDGLMAFWNAPLDVPHHPACACRAALKMRDAVPLIDAKAQARAAARGASHVPVVIGIGLNTGDVFVGNMGSEQRFDYSIVGDAVNVAARLESATKDFGVQIAVSDSIKQAAPEFLYVDLGKISLKGKAEAMQVYCLHGGPEDRTGDFDAFIDLHQKALDACANHDPNARDLLRAARRHPLGRSYKKFYDRLMKDESGIELEMEPETIITLGGS